MHSLKPEEGKWTGLAYYYCMQEGWYGDSPWEITDIDHAIKQFKEAGYKDIMDEEDQVYSRFLSENPELLRDIIDLLIHARDLNETVYISYE